MSTIKLCRQAYRESASRFLPGLYLQALSLFRPTNVGEWFQFFSNKRRDFSNLGLVLDFSAKEVNKLVLCRRQDKIKFQFLGRCDRLVLFKIAQTWGDRQALLVVSLTRDDAEAGDEARKGNSLHTSEVEISGKGKAPSLASLVSMSRFPPCRSAPKTASSRCIRWHCRVTLTRATTLPTPTSSASLPKARNVALLTVS